MLSVFPIMLWGSYPSKKFVAHLLGARNCASCWMRTVTKIDVVPLFGLLLAAKLVFETKDGKVPRTRGLGEAPKDTCHLHFLPSQTLAKDVRRRHQDW